MTSSLVALDVAILPPPDVSRRAIELSAALPPASSQGLRLGAEYIPHVTLTQQFVRAGDLDAAFERVASVLNGCGSLRLGITGGGKGGSAVWMTIDTTPALATLHANLMDALQPFEQPHGTTTAFADDDARPRDVAWVAGYRSESSYAMFTPHITLGHAAEPPVIAPMTFDVTTIAACQLGKFCSCRRVMRQWSLSPATA